MENLYKTNTKHTNIIICPICNTNYDGYSIKIFESDCHFKAFENINQHLIRFQCKICDVIFGPKDMLNLSEEKINKAYLDKFADGVIEADSSEWEYKLLTMLNPNSDGTYINWGAGLSKASEIANRNGIKLINYDPGIPNKFNYETLDSLLKNKVDGIISNNVLDHLQNPIYSLLQMKSILKDKASMIHASDGFRYNIHYTKFHLFFFVGKSVKYISKAIDMPHNIIPCDRSGTDIIKFTKI